MTDNGSSPLFSFKTIKKLGQGGQGSVLLVQQQKQQQSNQPLSSSSSSSLLPQQQQQQSHQQLFFALKRIPCPTLSHLNTALLEVQSVLQIKHEHVIRCHHFFIENDINNNNNNLSSSCSYRLSILYEYCERGNLMNEIDRARAVQLNFNKNNNNNNNISNNNNNNNNSSSNSSNSSESQKSSSKKNGGILDRSLIFKWMLQISKAVAHLHANSIVHRDLKPHNLFLTAARDVKIGDFGFAKTLLESDYANSVLGSQSYLAPEIRSQIPYNHKVDCWGIGAIFLDLLLPKTFDFAYEYGVNRTSMLETIEKRYDRDMVRLVEQVVVHDLEKRLDAAQIAELFERAYMQSFRLTPNSVVLGDNSTEGSQLTESSLILSSSPSGEEKSSIDWNSPSPIQNSCSPNEITILKEELTRLTLRCLELERMNEERNIELFFSQKRLKELEEEISSPTSAESTKSNSFKLFSLKKNSNNSVIPAKELTNVHKADFFGAFFALTNATWKSKEYNCEMSVILKSPHYLPGDAYTLDQFKDIVKYNQLIELKHPNLERVYGVVELDKRYHVVSELLKSNLHTFLLNHNNRLCLDDKIRIVLDVAEGLLYLHENGYVHTVLKTPSICFDNKQRAKLTSLHFAKQVDKATVKSFKAVEPRMKSPELITGNFTNPFVVEIYCFAFIMWEVLYRKKPYDNVTSLKISDIVTQHLRPAIQEPIGSPKEQAYVELMKMCWSSDSLARPSLRYIVYQLNQMLQQD